MKHQPYLDSDHQRVKAACFSVEVPFSLSHACHCVPVQCSCCSRLDKIAICCRAVSLALDLGPREASSVPFAFPSPPVGNSWQSARTGRKSSAAGPVINR